MIEVLEQSTPNCLAVRFSGKVTGEEYHRFLEAAAKYQDTGGQAGLVAELSGFEFYGDFEAAKKDFKFAFGDYKQFRRAAFVGDQKWLEWFARLVGPFTHAEEKHFPANQLEMALAWVQAV